MVYRMRCAHISSPAGCTARVPSQSCRSLLLWVMLAVQAGAHFGGASDAPRAVPTPVSSGSLEQLRLDHAVVRRGCTEEDAPALEIFLTGALFDGVGDPQPPFIRIEIGASAGERLTAVTLALQPLRRVAALNSRIARAEFVPDLGNRLRLSGTVTLDEVTPGSRARGRYHIKLPGGRRFTGQFSGPYLPTAAWCG